jgi:glycosyltransferase involved in cell wall biosynthesis
MECTNLASQLESIEFDRREDRQIIRILHIVGSMNVGGIETWLMNVLRSIDRDRFQIDFLVHTDQPCFYDEEIRSLGGKVIPCLNRSNHWHYSRNFSKILQQEGPYDVVHAHVHHFSGLVLKLAYHAGVPIRISHSHTSTSGARLKIARKLYLVLMNRWIRLYSTVGLAASCQAAADLFSCNWQQDPRYKILFCGIDIAPFKENLDRSTIRSELGIEPETLVIGHVGRLEAAKNHQFLIEIAAQVAKQQPNMCLLLVGEGSLRFQLEAKVRELGLEDRTIFTGGRSDVARLMMGAMDIFVMPSLYEGLGLALVEAQAARLPCVVADVIPSDADLVGDLICRLSLSTSPAIWAEMILEMNHKSLSQSTALSIVENSHFNLTISNQNLIKIYQSNGDCLVQ